MALPKKLLSIDIGTERIKIAHISRKKNKSTLLRSIILPTPRNSIKDGVLTNKEEISDVIKNALLTEKIKEKNVVFSISSSKVITRDVELPYLKPNKLENVIRLNAEEYFPVNLAEYSLDYTITDIIETEEGKKAKVIVFAAMSSVVNMYVELADMCKLKVVGVDYSGNSIVSFIKQEKIEGTNLFLDIGSESTMVVIMSNGVVKFSRNIMFGTRLINDSIMNHFEVDYEEAAKISKERQLLNTGMNESTYLTNDVTSGMEQILQGVSRLVDYYSSRNKNQVEKIYVLGGGAEIFGAEEYIEKFFNLRTEKFTTLKSVDDKSKANDSEMPLYLAAALGASVETINLLPAHIKNRDRNRAIQRIPYLLLVLLIVSLGAFYYTRYAEYEALQKQASNLQYDIDSMQDINEIIESHSEMTEKMSFRQQLDLLSTSRSDYLLDLIVGMEKTMPKDTFINTLSDTDVSLTIEVVAKDEATMAQMLTYLKDIKGGVYNGEEYYLFEDVYTDSIVQTGVDEGDEMFVTSTIVCTYTVLEVVE